MKEQRNKIVRFAMEYGLILAIYFIIKFTFTIFTLQWPILAIGSWALLIGIPFIIYKMVRIYRDRYNQGEIEFNLAWGLSMLLIFFASLPEALSQYFYYEFINPNYISESISQLTTLLKNFEETTDKQVVDNLLKTYQDADIPSAIQMAYQGIFNNLFFGSILSIIIAMLVKKKNQTIYRSYTDNDQDDTKTDQSENEDKNN